MHSSGPSVRPNLRTQEHPDFLKILNLPSLEVCKFYVKLYIQVPLYYKK